MIVDDIKFILVDFIMYMKVNLQRINIFLDLYQ